ncbi:hypothetical protein KDA_02700 [Dictyobacter alpinus]|uniref:DUF4190 domain-containing protein n=1 Tax=Dictyobacter alpinus TaxID=2014873 RepID=A0A402B0B0_9CHLR|nr:hypothetical protein [Dictyobacter alpinus]GCE24786.1 hypothetical protein KDA_02700 [Dictyobacter alpinus]
MQPPFQQPQQPTGYQQWPNNQPPQEYTPNNPQWGAQPPPAGNYQQWPNNQPPQPFYGYIDNRQYINFTTSYVTPAVVTMLLYFVFWLPGLIVNIVYFVQANETKRRNGGRSPEGYGCLLSLLLVWVLVPLAIWGGIFMLSIFSLLLTSTH